MYKKLIEFHRAGKVSFKYVKTFNMDEYVGKIVFAASKSLLTIELENIRPSNYFLLAVVL